MRKTWLMIGIIVVLTAPFVNINFCRFMDAHAVEKAKKPAKKAAPAPAPSVSERKGSIASKPAAAPAPAAKKIEETIPSNLIDAETLFSIQSIQGEYSGGYGPIGYNTTGIRSVVLSPDGKYLVTAADSKTIIYEVGTFNKIKEIDATKSFKPLSFSPDCRYLIANDHIYKVETWEEIGKLEHEGDVSSIDFSPGGRFVALGVEQNYSGIVYIFEVGTWKQLVKLNYYPQQGHYDGAVQDVKFSKNDKLLKVKKADGVEYFLETGTWKEIFQRKIDAIHGFSPNFDYVAIANGFDPYVTDLNGKLIATFGHYSGTVEYIGFLRDGRFLLIKPYQQPLFLYETSSWQRIQSLGGFSIKDINEQWFIVNYTTYENYKTNSTLYALDGSRLGMHYLLKDITGLGFKQTAQDLINHSKQIESDFNQKLQTIIVERNDSISKLGGPNKDEFETDLEYKARIVERNTKINELNRSFEVKRLSIRREQTEKRIRGVGQYEKEFNKLLIASRNPVKNLKLIPGIYIPDIETFLVTINTPGVESLNETVKVPRANARNFKDNIDKYQIAGEVQLDRTGKKRILNVVINNQDTGETYYVAKTATGQEGQVAMLPPNLSASIKFEEPSGTMALNAEETGKLIIRIKNDGKGSAYQVIARPIPTAPITDLSYEVEKVIPEIGPGTEHDIIFPLKAGLDLPTKQVQFNVSFEEKNGLPPNPVKISFQTRAVLKPDLQIVDYAIDNAAKDGIIKPEEVVKMTFRVQNKGQGTGRNVAAKVALGNNVFPALNMPLEHGLGELKPNAVKEFTIAFYANQRVRDKLPLKVDLVEDRKRFNAEKQYALSMGVKEKTVFETVVSAKDLQAVQITDLEASSDLEQDIPSTGVINRNAVAVVIGNYDYKNVQKVSFARRDAVVMKEYLVKTFGYDQGNIIFLPDATLSDMLNALGSAGAAKRSKLSSYLRPGSEIFVYYTGHGAPGLQDKKGYLVPIDADPNNIETTGYSLETLYRNLESLNASKLTVVIDACFSGDSQAGMLFKDASPIMVQAKSDKLNSGTVITSSSGDQISSWYPEKKHSLFTYFFLKGIKDKAARKEPVTIQNLKVYVADEVDRMSRRLYNRVQTPGFEGNLEERLIE